MSTPMPGTPTPGPTYFDMASPIPDYVNKGAKDINWDNPTLEEIKSNLSRVGGAKNVKGSSGFNPQAPTCEKPDPIKPADIFNKASELADSLGGDQECVKEARTKSDEWGKSNAYDERDGTDFDAQANYEANLLLASMKGGFSTSLRTKKSKTTSDQSHGTSMDNASLQKGCGSTLITATNMVQKQMAMQCVINNVSQTKDIQVGLTATISIQSLPMTDVEAGLKEKAIASLFRIQTTNSDSIKAISLALINRIDPTDLNFAAKITQTIQPMSDFYAKQETKMQMAVDSFSRDVTITNTNITNKTLTSVKVFDELTTSAKSDLATLSASIQKDAVSQAMANDMGTSAMDPNVKSMAQRACESTSSSSSSSITNLLNNMKCSMDSKNVISIVAYGRITIIGSEIGNNATAELCSQSIINQAVTNALSASAQFMSDTKNTQEVTNKVAGLNDLQKALGDTVANAIEKNQAAVINAQNADTAQALAYQKKVQAVTEAQLYKSPLAIIGGVIIVAIIAYFIFGGKKDNNNEMLATIMSGMKAK